jgi:hypothetical protein
MNIQHRHIPYYCFMTVIALSILSGIAGWSVEIESDYLKLTMDDATGLIDLQQKDPFVLLGDQLVLGTITLPDAKTTLDISKAGIPSLMFGLTAKNRIDVVIPIEALDKTFYMALALEGNTLYVIFDLKPVGVLWNSAKTFPGGGETLESLKSPADFSAVRILPNLIRLKKDEEGHLVVPYQEGTLIDFSQELKKTRDFDLFQNSGLTMPFWGVCTPLHSEVCIIDYLYAHLCYHPEEDALQLQPRFFHDPYKIPARMQIRFLGKDKNYIDIAKEYRNYLIARKELPSLKEKLSKKPQLVHLLEGANIKFPIYMKHEQRPDASGATPPPRVYNYQTFEDVYEVLNDMKANGVERLMAVWWGWGKEGYDRLHPDYLPPNPERGGAPVFKKMNEQITELGFSVGFHDNYTDIYEAAPSFENGSHCTVGPDGNNRRGGFWAGGQCWLLCSTEGLNYAQRNFEEMNNYGPINACFIDVLTAAPLFDCFSPVHPHTKWGDMKNKRAMMELVDKHFGIMGTEHGFSWGADLCDYFEGVGHDPNTRNEFFSGYGVSVPLFAAVYHDAIVQYMHQGAAVTPNAPDRLLFNLRAGGAGYFNVVRDRYENPEWKEYFLRAYQLSSNVIRRTWKTPLTSHMFLSGDKLVEKVTYGDDVMIVINRSNKEWQGTIEHQPHGQAGEPCDLVLAPHGFAVSSPDYAAFHGTKWGKMAFEISEWYTSDRRDSR